MAAHTPVCGRANLLDVVDKGEIYLTFVFNGIDSSQVGVVSVTSSGTYDTTLLPSFDDNYLDTDGYNGRYYFNTRLTQKEFSYNCFIDNLSPAQFEQLKAWLRPQKIGKLIRPEEPYIYYWAKVNSVDNLNNIPLTHPDTGGVSYTGDFSIEFTTIGQACGYGMFYYKDDLKYYEYRDIFDETEDYYYDTGLMYKEEMLPLTFSVESSTVTPGIYNPGTYESRMILTLTPSTDISEGTIVITNYTTGDVAVVVLNGLVAGDSLVLDWDKNEFLLNGETDWTENVTGDIMYLTPRDYVEKIDDASVANDGNVTMVTFDPAVRQVRSDDIGKTVMFKDNSTVLAGTGVGGKIASIDQDANGFILDTSAGLLTNSNASVVITELDNLSVQFVLPDGVTLDGEWSVKPRYL